MIPVEVARKIGQDLGLAWVLVLAYRTDAQTTETATWGGSPTDKEWCCAIRDRCLAAIGIDPDGGVTHQDYRFIEAGERAMIVDELASACRAAEHAIGSVLAVRDGISTELLQDVRDALRTALSKV